MGAFTSFPHAVARDRQRNQREHNHPAGSSLRPQVATDFSVHAYPLLNIISEARREEA